MIVLFIKMKAGVLRITDEVVDCDRTDILEQVRDILDDPENLILIEINDQNLNELIINTLMNSVPRELLENTDNADTKYTIGASGIGLCETKNSIYVAYFISLEDLLRKERIDRDDYESSNINRFGSQITSHNVASDVVIVKQRLSYDVSNKNIAASMSADSVTEYSLSQDLTTIFKHRALIVGANNDFESATLVEYHYIQNPLENVILTDSDYESHYRYHEYEVYNHRITVFVDLRESHNDENLNIVASHITGHKIYGKVLISLSGKPEFNSSAPYTDLTNDRLRLIAAIRSRSTDLTAEIGPSDKEYINFDKLLEIASITHSEIPIRPIETYSAEPKETTDVMVNPSNYSVSSEIEH